MTMLGVTRWYVVAVCQVLDLEIYRWDCLSFRERPVGSCTQPRAEFAAHAALSSSNFSSSSFSRHPCLEIGKAGLSSCRRQLFIKQYSAGTVRSASICQGGVVDQTPLWET